ncbi:MAG: serine/threonine protein kinase [Polyangiaceae bacterium]|nr:serine/threonine protein kinase [Polyangiaceae bacterium]
MAPASKRLALPGGRSGAKWYGDAVFMSAPPSLGPFTFLSTLGEGGSAFVYAARDETGREVALKVLRPELELEPREVQRFVEEAGKMRRVSHPALVPVLDVGMLPNGRPYIAMPRLLGRTLADRIAEGPLPVSRAVAMFEDVAHAVTALHDAGLVHRDLKPENVLWLDGAERLVVLDLGIAREADAIASTTTRSGKTRGTPAYMAPERFFGRPATVRTDVYELGVLLYVMLTGALPWDAEDPRGRMSPKLPAELGVLVPSPLVSVLMRALDVDFERRPDSVAALLHEVHQAAAISADGAAGPTDAAVTTRRAIVVTPPSPAAAISPQIDPGLAQAPTQISPARAFPIAHVTMPSAAPIGETPPHVATLASVPPTQSRSSGVTLLVAGAAIAVVAAVGGAVGVGALRTDQTKTTAPTTENASTPAPAPTPSATATEATPSPSPSASPSASASASSPNPSPSPSPSTGPGPGPAAPSTSAGSPPAPIGGMPPACAGYISLMCDPSSGSTPAECSAARQNVPRWIAISPSVAVETCGAALSQSRTGLALRRSSGPPPSAPPTAQPPSPSGGP